MDYVREVQVFTLTLNEGEDQNEELYRLKKGWILKINLSASLSWRKVRLFTNVCLNEIDRFQRNHYRELPWIYPSSGKYDDSDRYTDVSCSQSGTFHYYFTIDGTNIKEHQNGQGFFQIEPNLMWPDGSGEVLEQEFIMCQSVLSKSLGPLSEWSSRLEVTYRTGYNLIHFTPIQRLYSQSNSSYSISDHHRLNPVFQGTYEHVRLLIDRMAKEWRVLSIVDLVYNHVGNDCQLLKEHPEVAYNLINTPHLKPAVLLDSILIQFTRDASEGKLSSRGIPDDIKEYHLPLIRHYLLDEKFVEYRLWEFYVCDVDSLVSSFRDKLIKLDECPEHALYNDENLLKLDHGNYRRLRTTIDLDVAEKVYFFRRSHLKTREEFINEACQLMKNRLHFLNDVARQKLNENLDRAIENCLASCRYYFFSYDGPKYKKLSFPSTPFVGNYFYYPNDEVKHPDEINQLIENDLDYQLHVMAHNGWIMNDDPLRSFADSGDETYLRRDLIQWSDLIKLRFGSTRDDCSSLFEYMKEYTRLVATTFHGCRLDNCHSTPLWFAQQMMDFARELNPNFYINAELSTGNAKSDAFYINQIGINSLTKESYKAFDPFELGQMVTAVSEGTQIGSFFPSNPRRLIPRKPYAWFYDQTHDNPSQIERRSVEDTIPRSACVSMGHCSTGSTRGYDELVPHRVDVVHETRFYSRWGHQTRQVNENTAIIAIKRALNKLHIDLAQQGFSQLTVEQLSTSVLLMTRHDPHSHKSVLLISHTSFFQPSGKWEYINSLSVEGVIDEVLFEATISHPQEKEPVRSFQKSKEFINGLEQTKIYFNENLSIEQSRCIRLKSPNSPDYIGFRTIEFTNEFRPGSIVALQISLLPQIRQSIINLHEITRQFSNPFSQFNKIVERFTLIEYERVLYRTSEEEISDGLGFDVYVVPDYGKLHFCGLHGLVPLLDQIRSHNQLSHPLVVNLRQGNWLLDYIANRLKVCSSTRQLGDWYTNTFRSLTFLSRPMIPAYFDLILRTSYNKLLELSYRSMSQFVNRSSSFVHKLSQTSIQLISTVKGARLPLLSPGLREPRPVEEKDEQTLERRQNIPSLATGFPFFSTASWRNSTRNTFISLRGLFFLTQRYEEVRFVILSYAAYLRHGLLPNFLLDEKNPRYNSRDSVWWWLYSISHYTTIVPDGHDILSDKVSRLYPTDESSAQSPGSHDQPLFDIIYEVLLRHVQLLSFRERGSSFSLDAHMTDDGFNNQIGIDTRTGFVFGGNRWNCGTWMDKMGSSDKAGNRGHPATPRDGSAIELVALCRTTIAWLIRMNQEGFYPYDSVETSSGSLGKTKFLLTDWLNRIDENFEKEFWIDETNSDEFVNRTQIYKDTVNSTLKWTDYQFRPNFIVAAVIAPEMFQKTHIWLALKQAEVILLGKFGMKTLDPSDYNYIGDYVNDDDSYDYKRAQGFNYHNGPEWLWLAGYYIRAKLYWSKQQDDPSTVKQARRHVRQLMSSIISLFNSNSWGGLPELTNADGKSCSYACSTHCCSCATILEASFDLIKA